MHNAYSAPENVPSTSHIFTHFILTSTVLVVVLFSQKPGGTAQSNLHMVTELEKTHLGLGWPLNLCY